MNEPTQALAYKPSMKQKFTWSVIHPVQNWRRKHKLRKLDRLLDDLVDKDYHDVDLEFQSIGYTPLSETTEDDGPDRWIQENVIQLLKVFSTQGHSGSSAPYAISYFERLAKHKPLGPLTGEDREWVHVYDTDEGNAVYQNRRLGTVFKEVALDGTADCYDIDGIVFFEYYRDADGVQQKSHYTCRESRVPVEFPYFVPDHPVYQYRDREDAEC
jgi:hypothetical protein